MTDFDHVCLPQSTDPLVPNYPTHCRVTTQPLSVVHVFVPGQPPEHRLAQKTRQPMPTVLAGACIGQRISSGIGPVPEVKSPNQPPQRTGMHGIAFIRETLKNSATPISDQGKSIAWPFLQLRFRLFSVCP